MGCKGGFTNAKLTFMGVDGTTEKQTTALSTPTFVEISRLRGLTVRGRCMRAAQGPKHFKQWLEDQKAREAEQLSLAGLYPEEEGPEEDWDDTGPPEVMARSTVK